MSIEVEGFFFFFLFGCLLAKVADHFLHVCIILGWDEGLFFFFSFLFLCWNMCTLVSITG